MALTTKITSRATRTARAVKEWSKFLTKCLVSRLDPDKFEQFVGFHHARYPLPPIVLADLFLKPRPKNRDYIDPRIIWYLNILLRLKYIDTATLLRALYRYSTSHTQSHGAVSGMDGDASGEQILRWRSSYGLEEATFYALTKAVGQGTGIKNIREAVDVAAVMAQWMTLFTASSEAFAAGVIQLQASQSQTEMESARAAFVMLLLSVCENHIVLSALGRPYAKSRDRALSRPQRALLTRLAEVRARLSGGLASFIPSIQLSASPIAARLELFRTQTLAGFEPVDEKKEAEIIEIDNILDSTMGLQHFVIPDLAITNSRAGLYIYLNAAVRRRHIPILKDFVLMEIQLVGRPLIDNGTMYNYLHNRYQVRISRSPDTAVRLR